jgi:DNA repair photolyase
MGLNKSKGNMYDFINFTWNTIKGKCPIGCSYCFMKRWGEQKPVRFDYKELQTSLGENNFIFVGSSCDMFADDIPNNWIERTLEKCKTRRPNKYPNKYFFQSKNVCRMARFEKLMPANSSVCTTIETNRFYGDIMGQAPFPEGRAVWLRDGFRGLDKYVTIEPIMDFDLEPMVELIRSCEPLQVNIGANTSIKVKLPEPSKSKILDLIGELEKFTKIHSKKNLNRLLK